MASSFLGAASKKVTDVRAFLRDAAGGNSIKYSIEKGAKHLIYIPFINAAETDESGQTVTVKQLVAISGALHEWQSPDGKYKATICQKDIIRKSEDGETLLNDGTCPFCDRVSDAWDIWRYRKEMEEANCKLSGEERKKHFEKVNATFADERKAKDARPCMYILIVKYRTGADNNLVIGSDGLPEYDLKVMKMSSSKVEKIQQQIANAGSELPGSELMFEYPNVDDRRLQSSQSTTAPVFPSNMAITRYPNLLNKINEDVAKFDWEGIEKSFPEWSGMTTSEAKKITDGLFEQWDKYNSELTLNPGARYMEYITNTPVTTPQLGGVIPGVPTPGVGANDASSVPGAPAGVAAPTLPPIPDANSVFGASASGIQI